jgi:hypothetical protein
MIDDFWLAHPELARTPYAAPLPPPRGAVFTSIEATH